MNSKERNNNLKPQGKKPYNSARFDNRHFETTQEAQISQVTNWAGGKPVV